MHRHAQPTDRLAFTLVELLVVIVVVALLTTLVGLSVATHVHAAKLQLAADRVESLDEKARQLARETGAVVRLRFEAGGVELMSRSQREIVSLSDVSLTAIPSTVVVEPGGRSDSYQVRLAATDEATLHLLTLGLTGQRYRFADAQSLEAALR